MSSGEEKSTGLDEERGEGGNTGEEGEAGGGGGAVKRRWDGAGNAVSIK